MTKVASSKEELNMLKFIVHFDEDKNIFFFKLKISLYIVDDRAYFYRLLD